MKSMICRILVVTFCVSQAVGFAGLTPNEVAPFVENANTVIAANSIPIAGELLNSYKHALQVNPLETKMLTGGLLATLGDAIAQSQTPDEPYDKTRAASFAAFDMCYRALQHFVFPIIVAECTGKVFLSALTSIPALAKVASQNVDSLAALEQTLASQLGVVPFIYYPIFFALVCIISVCL